VWHWIASPAQPVGEPIDLCLELHDVPPAPPLRACLPCRWEPPRLYAPGITGATGTPLQLRSCVATSGHVWIWEVVLPSKQTVRSQSFAFVLLHVYQSAWA
jgi:hypothetical protein